MYVDIYIDMCVDVYVDMCIWRVVGCGCGYVVDRVDRVDKVDVDR